MTVPCRPPRDWSGGRPDVQVADGITTYGHEAEVLRSLTTIFYEERPKIWDLKTEGWLPHFNCSQVMLASGSSNEATRALLGRPESPIFAPRIGDFSFPLEYSIGMGTGTVRRLQYGKEITRNALAIWNKQGMRILQADKQGKDQTDDYLLVTRMPGPTPDSVYTVLAGLHGPETRAAELLLSGVSQGDLDQLADRIDHKPECVSYFQAIFRASKFNPHIGKSDVAEKLELVTEACPPIKLGAKWHGKP